MLKFNFYQKYSNTVFKKIPSYLNRFNQLNYAMTMNCSQKMYLYDKKYQDEGINEFKLRPNESTQNKRKRLLYQSRKRGMLENGLVLSQFSGKYLKDMTRDELDQYDIILNRPSNDWELFYWISNQKKVPSIYQNKIFDKLMDFAKNKNKECRYFQPEIQIFDN